MGWYERYVCPWLTERSLDNGWVRKHRRRLIEPIEGRVLELGFGTGLNLPFYTDRVSRLDILDPAEGMHARAKERIAAATIDVHSHRLSAETLPFDDDVFDAVVSTFTLCTIRDVEAALREVRRVLAPGGHLRIFEHVASRSSSVRRWQDRLTPIQKVIGCGCHLNRDAQAIMHSAGFDVADIERVEEPRMHALVREHAFGAAR